MIYSRKYREKQAQKIRVKLYDKAGIITKVKKEDVILQGNFPKYSETEEKFLVAVKPSTVKMMPDSEEIEKNTHIKENQIMLGDFGIRRHGNNLFLYDFYPNGPELAKISRLMRRKGIGSTVINHLSELAKNHNISRIVVKSPSQEAIKFYEAVGFLQTAPGEFIKPLNVKEAREILKSKIADVCFASDRIKNLLIGKLDKIQTVEDANKFWKKFLARKWQLN